MTSGIAERKNLKAWQARWWKKDSLKTYWSRRAPKKPLRLMDVVDTSINGKAVSGADVIVKPLSLGDFIRITKQVTYKPGWRFETFLGHHFISVTLSAQLIDATNPEGTVTIYARDSHSREEIALLSERGVLNLLYEQIKRIELHEIEEFLRYKGEYFKHPHPLVCMYSLL